MIIPGWIQVVPKLWGLWSISHSITIHKQLLRSKPTNALSNLSNDRAQSSQKWT